MRHCRKIVAALIALFVLVPSQGDASQEKGPDIPSFNDKLQEKVEFETAGQTLVESVLSIAYQHELPIGIEYLNREALTRPIDLRFQKESIREILVAITRQIPEYQITFSDGLVNIFVPSERQDSSNLLNRVIKDFNVTERDAAEANAELACALAQAVDPSRVCVSSIAKGQFGKRKITIHRTNAKAYELINAIVAQNGNAAWTVIVPPARLTGSDTGDLWHIYPLQTPFKQAVLDKLSALKP